MKKLASFIAIFLIGSTVFSMETETITETVHKKNAKKKIKWFDGPQLLLEGIKQYITPKAIVKVTKEDVPEQFFSHCDAKEIYLLRDRDGFFFRASYILEISILIPPSPDEEFYEYQDAEHPTFSNSLMIISTTNKTIFEYIKAEYEKNQKNNN